MIFIAMKVTKPLWENYTVEPLMKEELHPDIIYFYYIYFFYVFIYFYSV